MKRRVKEWLFFSKQDLVAVEKLLESESLTQIAAFHCQQSIEKSFKAVIEEHENSIPKLHDLIRLYDRIVNVGVKLDFDFLMLIEINNVYIESRYPTDFLGLYN